MPVTSFPFEASAELRGVLGFPVARGGMSCPQHNAHSRALPNVGPPSPALPGGGHRCGWEELERAPQPPSGVMEGSGCGSLWAARGGNAGRQGGRTGR